jgi:PleD family two-component response regulator
MSTEPEVHLKSNSTQEGRKKFWVKIMVTKKGKHKRPPRTPNPYQRLHHEMDGHLKEIKKHKKKIEELTKSTIDELMRLHDLHKKAKKLQFPQNQITEMASQNNDNHKFELDYELTNLKMIKKILALATPFELTQQPPEGKTKSRKKPAAIKAKEKPIRKEQETNVTTKILIVEDDRTTIKIITHILEQHDYKVEFATDAEEGLKKSLKEKPDLILLDIMMPGMDGFQLLAKLQATEETSWIPVIILSSLSGEKDILKGLERGATDYILKPFSPQILFFKIKKLLSLKNEHFTDNRHV